MAERDCQKLQGLDNQQPSSEQEKVQRLGSLKSVERARAAVQAKIQSHLLRNQEGFNSEPQGNVGKEITLNLQDALFSAKSMAVMFGDQNFGTDSITANGKILRTWNIFGLYDTAPTTLKHGTKDVTVPESAVYYTATGEKEQEFNKATSAFVTFEVEAKDVMTIKINPDTFSGTYYVTGDTYARSEDTGEDELTRNSSLAA